jgi:RNA polymerase sigma factor (sigma-70 family)
MIPWRLLELARQDRGFVGNAFMAQDKEDFGLLMQRIRAGSQDAARELCDHYGPHILRVIRKKLNKRLRSKYDSSDFTQAVWASFFANLPDDPTLDRPEALAGFLAKLTQNKVIDVFRHHCQTQKHNINRECSLDDPATSPAANLIAPQPTPSQVAVAKEQWDRLLKGQPACYRPILVLLLHGHTHQEIARKLGMSEKTIQRLVRSLAQRSPQ